MHKFKTLLPLLLLLTVVLPGCATQPSKAEAVTAPATTGQPVSGASKSGQAAAKDKTTNSTSGAVASPVIGAAETVVARDTYVIQPGDILTISVWREEDLQGEYAVRPDGGLNFPLAGEIAASGKTIEQLQKEITGKLAKYVPDPVVTATVKQSLGNRIYVVGKVHKPGDFSVNRNIDVMQALSMAGGPTPYASVNKIKILRRINGEQKTFVFRYADVEKGKKLEQNIVLQGGDIVVVP